MDVYLISDSEVEWIMVVFTEIGYSGVETNVCFI